MESQSCDVMQSRRLPPPLRAPVALNENLFFTGNIANSAKRTNALSLRPMANKDKTLDVACPCCAATLKVDAATGGVIAHTPPPRQKMFEDLEAAARAMKE